MNISSTIATTISALDHTDFGTDGDYQGAMLVNLAVALLNDAQVSDQDVTIFLNHLLDHIKDNGNRSYTIEVIHNHLKALR